MACGSGINPAADGTVLLHVPGARHWLYFQNPQEILAAHNVGEVIPVLKEVERRTERGEFAAGFVSYEAASAFDPALKTHHSDANGVPLVWFGMYARPEEISRLPEHPYERVPMDWSSLPFDAATYKTAIRTIKSYIQAGDTYQVNFSLRFRKTYTTGPWDIFRNLVEAQGPHFGAFIHTDAWSICSASPELFFELKADCITCRPMKGTAARGLWPDADTEQSRKLLESEKDRAENLMIVDMVRNDLGRVASPGTVKVERLFDLERYPTLWQMTSTVTARTSASVVDIFRALFPAASITGAPKIRTTELIAELESSPRQIYTGVIGYIAPGRRAQFNVAIRTMQIDHRQHTCEYGVGSGIVWDSSPEQELNECRLKMKILNEPPRDFHLIETILWEPGNGYFLLELHLSRMGASAAYFDRKFDVKELRGKLTELAEAAPQEQVAVRVNLSPTGALELTKRTVSEDRGTFRVRLADRPVDSQNVLLYHKTSDRDIYAQHCAEHHGFDAVLLWNERGELTEGTIANLVVEKNGELLTPPTHSGLLAGVYRSFLLGKKQIREQVLRVGDLESCSKVFLINSVRRMWEITVTKEGGGPQHDKNSHPNPRPVAQTYE